MTEVALDPHVAAVFHDAGSGFRVACTCGWWTSERSFRDPAGAHAAHASHVVRQLAAPRCPCCGDFRDGGRLVDAPVCAGDVPGNHGAYHEVVCDQPWAGWECLRCELRFTQEAAAEMAGRMLTRSA